ncbi:MAG TPA: DUF3298 domain-containing protein [Candidatus Peribacteraceae bacterium]|nr:DUF3298 domain-containing protein [Candidatus Peribacteraceae bacterium]
MRKTTTILVFCSLFLAACGQNNTGGVNLKTDNLNETHDAYTVSVNIPQVHGLKNDKAQTDINAALEKIAHDQRDSFVKDALQTPVDTATRTKSGLTIDYKGMTLSQNFISILFQASPYMSGAAHPNSYTFSYNYDVDTGAEIKLSDLFKPKSDYLKKLSDLSIAKLIDLSKKNQTYYDQKKQWISEGAGPKAENFKTFMIQNGELLLTFDPYQVGPYAEGDQTIEISRPEIIEILSDEGRKILSETQRTTSQ